MPCAMSAAMRLTMTGKYDTGNGNGNGMVILMMAPLFLNGLFLLIQTCMYVHMSNELPLFMYTFINSLYILTYMQKMYVKKMFLYIHKYVCIKFF